MESRSESDSANIKSGSDNVMDGDMVYVHDSVTDGDMKTGSDGVRFGNKESESITNMERRLSILGSIYVVCLTRFHTEVWR